ncbi:hypothetical protein TgHK011_006390 [Trichoderma gracile]|nr:hypothetical protein TgHK011_006390 [Trichoderma gracile]
MSGQADAPHPLLLDHYSRCYSRTPALHLRPGFCSLLVLELARCQLVSTVLTKYRYRYWTGIELDGGTESRPFLSYERSKTTDPGVTARRAVLLMGDPSSIASSSLLLSCSHRETVNTKTHSYQYLRGASRAKAPKGGIARSTPPYKRSAKVPLGSGAAVRSCHYIVASSPRLLAGELAIVYVPRPSHESTRAREYSLSLLALSLLRRRLVPVPVPVPGFLFLQTNRVHVSAAPRPGHSGGRQPSGAKKQIAPRSAGADWLLATSYRNRLLSVASASPQADEVHLKALPLRRGDSRTGSTTDAWSPVTADTRTREKRLFMWFALFHFSSLCQLISVRGMPMDIAIAVRGLISIARASFGYPPKFERGGGVKSPPISGSFAIYLGRGNGSVLFLVLPLSGRSKEALESAALCSMTQRIQYRGRENGPSNRETSATFHTNESLNRADVILFHNDPMVSVLIFQHLKRK